MYHIGDILDELQIEYVLRGDGTFEVLGLLASRTDKKLCSFVMSRKFVGDVPENVSVLLTNEETAPACGANCCIVDDPRNVLFKIHNYLSERADYRASEISDSRGKNCDISPLAHIEKGVEIGDNVVIEPFVTIKTNTFLGNNVVVRSGSVIGGEGFEFKREGEEIFPVKHVGKVIIEDNVEIQQNACIDKAIYPWDSTVIGRYTKIDNFVHIAHGVKIGKLTLIVANSGIGGRVTIGNECWIGFGVTIRNGISIGDNARVNMGAVVTKDVAAGQAVSGNFAIPHDEFLKKLKGE